MESASRNPLTGVKEEPCGARARDLEEEYFRTLPLLPASFLSLVLIDFYYFPDTMVLPC